MAENNYAKSIHADQSNGDKIRAIRKRKGMTIKHLAEVCGVSSKTIQHYETGERQVNAEMLKLIAEKLKANPAALYEYPFESISDVMHILFDLERSGFFVLAECEPDSDEQYASFSLRASNEDLGCALKEWYEMRCMLENGRVSNDEYLNWQDAFPDLEQYSESEKDNTSNTASATERNSVPSQKSASIYRRNGVLRLRAHADHALYGMNGTLVPNNIQNQICRYTNCTVEFLNDESQVHFIPQKAHISGAPQDENTLFEILSILDKNADTEHYRVIQIQLSRIAIHNIVKKGFDRDAFYMKELIQESIDYLFTGKKARRHGTYFGFNFSQLDLLRERTGVSIPEMFMGTD